MATTTTVRLTSSGESQADAGARDSEQYALYKEASTEFGSALGRLANAYEANADRRQDLLQDIHLALWRSFASFARECSLRTWVYRVAHNTAASHVLRSKRRRDTGIDLEELANMPLEHDGERTIDEAAVLQKLNRLIQKLKPLDRDVILLYLEELEATDIAEIVGLSASNVAQKIHRIKKLLQRHFA